MARAPGRVCSSQLVLAAGRLRQHFASQEVGHGRSDGFRFIQMNVMIARHRHHCVLGQTQTERGLQTAGSVTAETAEKKSQQTTFWIFILSPTGRLTFLSCKYWRSSEVNLFWAGSESARSQPSSDLKETILLDIAGHNLRKDVFFFTSDRLPTEKKKQHLKSRRNLDLTALTPAQTVIESYLCPFYLAGHPPSMCTQFRIGWRRTLEFQFHSWSWVEFKMRQQTRCTGSIWICIKYRGIKNLRHSLSIRSTY